ncbi:MULTISPECIES: SDR family NAD(P)-dependent oxidoreductase [unclassified Chryseobacterium]|uniref:SDR family NAD(P)-dependent oxidoreductase n=1 Tax=unclassified Chryseobacterium TaxID=2593645 RepID=UPI00100A7B5A|nr:MULTISPECIES: SDR family NAD(P)-dependent oxidoreductase [unclassified Chryseobacterium]RXM52964.1 short-chain dehydrogenase/reductase [Chryseobacterium sp. CH25]RXM65840.1 short-chain dehydrogenase/reductase [Chryseobacterium sp. CH1]
MENSQKEKVWFITGSSRGFGKIWTETALKRGDKVAATARNINSIAALKETYGDQVLVLEVDVTNALQVQNAMSKANEYFGRLDVVFNNAGYSLVGTIEEGSTDEVKAMYETNIIGSIHVIQAALPILRAQGHGHILGTSSAVGIYSNPLIGYYCSSKFAFEAIYDSLSKEVAGFGIKVTLIEPGAYNTEFGSAESLKIASKRLADYDDLKSRLMENLQKLERGNPIATPDAIFAVVDTENPPLRLLLGKNDLPHIQQIYAERLQEWETWKTISVAAQG